MKLRKLHIEDYKMFKDFDISFVDENDEALPIVILAGVNGSGKTTLLSFVNQFTEYINEVNENYIDFEFDNGLFGKEYSKVDKLNGYSDIEFLKKNIFYFPVKVELKNIKKFLPKYIQDIMYTKNIRPNEMHEKIRVDINKVFQDLDTQIEFDSRDGEGNLFFRNKGGEDKFSIDNLSTGEKTLISKVLYLYLEDIKDKVILIDEPELSLHPSWQNKVLKIYENFALKNNCQIIIATHSPHIIGSAKNEYLRILRKNEEGNVEVVSGLKAHGRDINSILFDVMGEVAYRPREFDDKIDRLFIEIDNKNLEEAKKQLEALKKSYGEKDSTIMEAQMLIDMFSEE